MFLALFLVRSAFAVCDFANPVLVADATQTIDVRADCYSTPGPGFDDGLSTDTWRLSLDSVDVQEILDGTCSVEIDNGTFGWRARARSSIHTTHDKVLRRDIDATLRLTTVTVYDGGPTVLTPGDIACSGEDTTSSSGLVFQVPSTCPSGGANVTLADGSVASCTLEQAAPLLWTTLTTGAGAIPDIGADNLRDLLMLAMMGIHEPDACAVTPYPAVDIEFEREVYADGSCASNVGKIDGEMWVDPPTDPTTVSLGAAAVSCATAATDVTLLDCVPTLGGP